MQPTILSAGDDVDTNDNANQEGSAGKSRGLWGVVGWCQRGAWALAWLPSGFLPFTAFWTAVHVHSSDTLVAFCPGLLGSGPAPVSQDTEALRHASAQLSTSLMRSAGHLWGPQAHFLRPGLVSARCLPWEEPWCCAGSRDHIQPAAGCGPGLGRVSHPGWGWGSVSPRPPCGLVPLSAGNAAVL